MMDWLANWSTTELISAVLDIGIVSYLIYRTLLLIQGTRAVQMLVGVLMLILFFFLSTEEYANLQTLNWLLDKFIASFMIVIVVIFQEDIRRALTQVGRNPVAATGGGETDEPIYEVLVGGVMQLAASRIGAIIALERTADLTPYTKEGVRVDAAVSRELLMSLFQTAHLNTLHDGGVIIREERVSHAGCFFPLTVNPKIERELGTRHRAAIGLSEETDAYVIVVSEETGRLSVAMNGELLRNFTEESLRAHLRGAFHTEGRSNLWRRLGRSEEEGG
jgi:diadenylate cyclase